MTPGFVKKSDRKKGLQAVSEVGLKVLSEWIVMKIKVIRSSTV
jgi:hypothetical protein